MTVWDDEAFTADVVRRYVVDGDGPTLIAKCLDLTRNQVIAKLRNLGHLRQRTPGAYDRERKPAVSRRVARAADPNSIASRVLACLKAGPKGTREIADQTGFPRQSVTRAAQQLIQRGKARILNPGRAVAVYGLAEGGRLGVALADVSLAEAEGAYVAARRQGKAAPEAARLYAPTATSANDFEKYFRLQTTSAFSRDGTCPKFAHDDRHLKVVWSNRGFPALAERRRSGDHVAVCLPLTWPEVRP